MNSQGQPCRLNPASSMNETVRQLLGAGRVCHERMRACVEMNDRATVLREPIIAAFASHQSLKAPGLIRDCVVEEVANTAMNDIVGLWPEG